MSSLKFESVGQTHVFTSFPDSQSEDTDKLIEDQDGHLNNIPENFLAEDVTKNYSIWQLEYYQKYFNVNTSDVTARILGSMIPTFNHNFLLNKIRPNPDLYGPFWIIISLVFCIAISGNLYSFVHNFGSEYYWQTDFQKVTSLAATVLAYWCIIPTIIYILIRWRQNNAEFEFIEILCLYGYSFSIFIPISILWFIQISFIQWSLVILGTVLSGSVLMLTFWPIFNNDNNKKFGLGIMIFILAMHALLGISFMVFFFHDTRNKSTVSQSSTFASTITIPLTQSTKLFVSETVKVTEAFLTKDKSRFNPLNATRSQ